MIFFATKQIKLFSNVMAFYTLSMDENIKKMSKSKNYNSIEEHTKVNTIIKYGCKI